MSNDNYNPKSVDATLARIETHQESCGQKLDSLIVRIDSHSRRISALENWRYYILGGLALGGFVIYLLK